MPSNVVHHRGFTLVELSVVAVILAIIASSSIVALGAIQAAEAEAGVTQIRNELEATAQRARHAGGRFGIEIDASANALVAKQIDALSGSITDHNSLEAQPRSLSPIGTPQGRLDILSIQRGADAPMQSAILWWDHRGRPVERDSSGSLIAIEQDPITILLQVASDQTAIEIRPISGAIE